MHQRILAKPETTGFSRRFVIGYQHIGARVIWRNRKAAGHRIRLAAAQLLFLVDASLLAMRLPFLPSQRRDSFAIVHVNHRWQQRVRPASVSQDMPRLGNEVGGQHPFWQSVTSEPYYPDQTNNAVNAWRSPPDKQRWQSLAFTVVAVAVSHAWSTSKAREAPGTA